MSKRKPIDKEQARERRNRLLETAAAAELSITEGVREMRAIAGMTQEEFARHRGVSARVIKGIELGQANPTVATLNQIGQFFGLEVGFVPIRRTPAATAETLPGQVTDSDWTRKVNEARELIMRQMSEALAALESVAMSIPQHGTVHKNDPPDASVSTTPPDKKRKARP